MNYFIVPDKQLSDAPKVIGGVLTLRQLAILAGGAVAAAALFILPLPIPLRVTLAALAALTAVAFSIPFFDGEGLDQWLWNWYRFKTTDREYVYLSPAAARRKE